MDRIFAEAAKGAQPRKPADDEKQATPSAAGAVGPDGQPLPKGVVLGPDGKPYV